MFNPIRIRKNKMILDKFRYKATLAAFVTMCFLTSTITKTLHIRFIMVKIQNEGTEPYQIKKGNAIVQCVFAKFLTVDNEEEILNERIGGIGSTDRSE